MIHSAFERIFLSGLLVIAFVVAARLFIAGSRWWVRSGFRQSRLRASLATGTPALLYFWSAGCAQCSPQESQIEQAREILQRSGNTLNVRKLNALEEKHLVKSMRVMTVPTTVMLDPSGNVAAWNPGLIMAEKIVTQYVRLLQPREI